VRAAASASEALARIRDADVDVLVSDLGMPDGDGFELVRTVRERERQRGESGLAAVALTAYASGEDRARAFEAGFDVHVVKPLTPRSLIEIVARAVRARHALSGPRSGRG
jgi:CheY-like chemotaxis protein